MGPLLLPPQNSPVLSTKHHSFKDKICYFPYGFFFCCPSEHICCQPSTKNQQKLQQTWNTSFYNFFKLFYYIFSFSEWLIHFILFYFFVVKMLFIFYSHIREVFLVSQSNNSVQYFLFQKWCSNYNKAPSVRKTMLESVFYFGNELQELKLCVWHKEFHKSVKFIHI